MMDGVLLLPNDIITEILALLSTKSVLRFRCVCKTWCGLIDHPEFATVRFSRATKADTKSTFIFLPSSQSRVPYTVFMAYQKKPEVSNPDLEFTKDIQFFRPICNNLSKCYSNGLFCVSSIEIEPNHRVDVTIVNPTTRQFAKLPNLLSLCSQPQKHVIDGWNGRQRYKEVVPGFGFDNSSKKYKVVLLLGAILYRNLNLEAQVFTLDSNSNSKSFSWRILENVPQVYLANQCTRLSRASCLSCNGSLHWLTASADLLTFNLSSEEFGFIPHPQLSSLEFHLYANQYQLTDIGGCLSIADLYYYGRIELWIMKDYNVLDSWTKVIIQTSYDVMGFWSYQEPWRTVLPICLGENNEIILLLDSKLLFSYNTETGRYTRLELGLPDFYGNPEIYENYEVYPYVENIISFRAVCGLQE